HSHPLILIARKQDVALLCGGVQHMDRLAVLRLECMPLCIREFDGHHATLWNRSQVHYAKELPCSSNCCGRRTFTLSLRFGAVRFTSRERNWLRGKEGSLMRCLSRITP